MKHKHYDQIVAWAGGAAIQYLEQVNPPLWCDISPPNWVFETEYRVKPEILRFRLALLKITYSTGDRFVVKIYYTESEELLKSSNFIRWLSDWQEVEVCSKK